VLMQFNVNAVVSPIASSPIGQYGFVSRDFLYSKIGCMPEEFRQHAIGGCNGSPYHIGISRVACQRSIQNVLSQVCATRKKHGSSQQEYFYSCFHIRLRSDGLKCRVESHYKCPGFGITIQVDAERLYPLA